MRRPGSLPVVRSLKRGIILHMDNHIFRSAALGFSRQDVMDYIEKTQKEAETAAAALKKQLDAAYEELAGVKQQLEEANNRTEELSGRLETLQAEFEQIKTEKDGLLEETAKHDKAIQSLTEEKDGLADRVRELSEQQEVVRREKEKLAQLELDAHQRADVLMAQTQAEADALMRKAREEAEKIITAANSQAADTAAQAEADREALLGEMENQVDVCARQCGELFASCERITEHIANELRKLDVANAQLPIGLGSLKAKLAELSELSKER